MANKNEIMISSKDKHPVQTKKATLLAFQQIGTALKSAGQQIEQSGDPANQNQRYILDQVTKRINHTITSGLIIQSTQRYVRHEDYVPIGAHPGIHIIGNSNGGTFHANIFGGLRDSNAAIDNHESRRQIANLGSHGTRTEQIIQRPTRVTLITQDQNGVQTTNTQVTLHKPHGPIILDHASAIYNDGSSRLEVNRITVEPHKDATTSSVPKIMEKITKLLPVFSRRK